MANTHIRSIGAYRQHQAGALTWKLAGTWAGVLGAFAVGDYYFSQYVFSVVAVEMGLCMVLIMLIS